MVNLDLIGGVSYTKGCYPGQEIVARMHYLGRLKQRMYRVRVATPDSVAPGDPLFSAEFGAEQASGSIVQAIARDDGAHEALAVVQIASARSDALRFKSLSGPGIEFLSLPYEMPT
jgi:folate-binding Fe-S cluster repair protein YgfZ